MITVCKGAFMLFYAEATKEMQIFVYSLTCFSGSRLYNLSYIHDSLVLH